MHLSPVPFQSAHNDLEGEYAKLLKAFPLREGEQSREKLREFWKKQGLSVEKMDLLLWGGEIEPRLRQINYLDKMVRCLEEVSGDVLGHDSVPEAQAPRGNRY